VSPGTTRVREGTRSLVPLSRRQATPPEGTLASMQDGLQGSLGLNGTLEFGSVQAPLSKQSLANVFSAETGLLQSLRRDRVSGRAESTRDMALPTRPELLNGVKPSARQASERDMAVGEVQSLATILQLAMSSTGGVGVEEMKLARKERQEQACEAYNKRKGYLNVEVELRTGQAARSFKQLLSLNDSEIESFFEELNDEFLTRLEMADVSQIGQSVGSQGPRRATWIAEFESELDEMEAERRQSAHIELCQLMDACVEIAHMLPNELERELEKMTSEVNMLIISNKEVHAELVARLRIGEVKRQRKHRLKFVQRLAAWRAACHAHALELFKETMVSAAIVSPDERREALAELRKAQGNFAEQRVVLLKSLTEMAESGSTLTAEAGQAKVAEAVELAEGEAGMHFAFLNQLRAADKVTDAHVLEAIERVRTRLKHFGHLDAEGVATIVEEEAEPLAAVRRKEASELIDRVGLALETQLHRLHEGTLRTVAMFTQAGSELDAHNERAVELFKNFREELHQIRRGHEHTDREIESELDGTVTLMRQEASEAGAAVHLAKALLLLEQVEEGYRMFGKETLSMLHAHPQSVEAEISLFSAKACGHVQMLTEKDYVDWVHARRERLTSAEVSARIVAAEYDKETNAAAAAAAEPKGGEKGKAAAVAAVEVVPQPAALFQKEEVMVAADEDSELLDEIAQWGATFPNDWTSEMILDAEARGEDYREIDDYTQALRIRSVDGIWYRLLTAEEEPLFLKDKEREERLAARRASASNASLAEEEEGAKLSPLEALEAASADLAAFSRTLSGGLAAEGKEDDSGRNGLQAELLNTEAPLDTDGGRCISREELNADLLHNLRRSLATSLASHLERHSSELITRAREDVEALHDSVRVELDERLLAHRPRAGRLELDVRDSRLDEIHAHRELFGRHARSVARRGAAQRENFELSAKAVQLAVAGFVKQMGERERGLRNPKNTHAATIERLRRDAEAAASLFKRQVHEEELQALRALSASALEQQRALNGTFSASMRTWEEGGTYHADEMHKFQERLDALDADAEQTHAQQRERIAALDGEAVAGADKSDASFNAALQLNRADLNTIGLAKTAHAAGAAVMRTHFNDSDEAESKIGNLALALAEALRGVDGGAEGSDGDAEADVREARLRAMLAIFDELRNRCLARAKHLEVLESLVPEANISIDVDGGGPVVAAAVAVAEVVEPKGKKEAAAPAKGKAEAVPAAVASTPPPGSDPSALVASIESVRLKTEQALLALYGSYYAGKGEREVTRPAELAPNQEEAGRRVGTLLAHFSNKATQHRRAKSRLFRSQLFELESLLPAVAAVALDTTRAIACGRAEAEAKRLRAAYEKRRADLAKRRHVHEASLKPSLSNPNRRAELEALEAAEAQRLGTAKAAASELQRLLIASETAHAADFQRRLLRTIEVISAQLDHFVFPVDLLPPEEPPEARRKPLRVKLVEEVIELTSVGMPEPVPGRKFPLKVWPPLPADELTAEAADVADALSGAPAADAPAPALPRPPAAQELKTFLTKPHRFTFASRDRVYATMRTRYHETTRQVYNECQALLREEDAWSRNWASMTSMLKK